MPPKVAESRTSPDISLPVDPRIEREHGRLLAFTDVEERLIEAWGFLMRLPDREAGWTRVRAYWPEMRRHNALGDYGDMEPEAKPRLPGLRAREVDRMNEALGWIDWIDQRDRKLIGVVLAQLSGDNPRPSWRGAAIALGWGGHPDTLSKRYDRAIARIAAKLSSL